MIHLPTEEEYVKLTNTQKIKLATEIYKKTLETIYGYPISVDVTIEDLRPSDVYAEVVEQEDVRLYKSEFLGDYATHLIINEEGLEINLSSFKTK